jgi:hypothetical protein
MMSELSLSPAHTQQASNRARKTEDSKRRTHTNEQLFAICAGGTIVNCAQQYGAAQRQRHIVKRMCAHAQKNSWAVLGWRPRDTPRAMEHWHLREQLDDKRRLAPIHLEGCTCGRRSQALV